VPGGSAAALTCDTGALIDYLVESAPDHERFRDVIDGARTRYVPGLVLAELDYFLRDERLVIAHRDVATPAVLRGAIDALLGGPTADEAAAGMTSTVLEHPQEIVRGRGRQYVRGAAPLTFLTAPYVDLSVKWAGGGIISTASDLARFAIALDQGKLLKAETLERMYTSARLNNGSLTGYGLGWMVAQEAGRTLVAHSGGAMGGTTYLLHDPKAQVVSVVLTNLDDVARLRDLALQLLTLAPRPLPVSTR